MRSSEKGNGTFPACGYGLLGLCCTHCLLGPCRVHPFERGSARVLCAEGPDEIVAKNLLRTVTLEATLNISRLREAFLRFEKWGSSRPSTKRRGGSEKEKLAGKYGFPSDWPLRKMVRTLSFGTRALLSPFPEKEVSLLPWLLPEKTFPPIDQKGGGDGSFINLLLDSAELTQGRPTELSALLWQCLSLSRMTVLSEQIQRDIHILIDGGTETIAEGEIPALLEGLPSVSTPFLLVVTDETMPCQESSNTARDALVQRLKEAVPIVQLRQTGSLPEVGRRLSQKWRRPVSEIRAMTLLSSSQATRVLGALALGFHVMSFPPLPLHGSKRVEAFFLKDLGTRLGNRYFVSWEDDLFSQVQAFLT